MTKWISWIALTALTGSPFLSLGILLVAWWLLDRFTLGVLPDPFRFAARLSRMAALRRTIAQNPHDRRARAELADLYVTHRRFAKAVEVLRPSLEAGDDDAPTLFLMGVACAGAKHFDQAEVFLSTVAESEPGFRQGAVQLELGRARLDRGDAAAARAPLEAFSAARQGTVEGKVLLARALSALGDEAGARKLRDDAWADFASAPRFTRKQERFWAWRARPSRPLSYVAVALVCGALFFAFGRPVLAALVPESPPLEAFDEALPPPDGE